MELLIRVHNKQGYDPAKHVVDCAGDVIVACPDGWGWSSTERSNPEWRIVRCPLLKSELDALLEPGEKSFRRYKVDVRALAYHMEVDERVHDVVDIPRDLMVTAIRMGAV